MHETGNVHYTINLVDEYGEKSMLSNSKKYYFSRRVRRNYPVLPLGVRYSSREKYYGVFTPCGGESIRVTLPFTILQ